jgi:hypothetical protein
MASILARSNCSQEELSFDTLEIADNFGISVPERTGYISSMSVTRLCHSMAIKMITIHNNRGITAIIILLTQLYLINSM